MTNLSGAHMQYVLIVAVLAALVAGYLLGKVNRP